MASFKDSKGSPLKEINIPKRSINGSQVSTFKMDQENIYSYLVWIDSRTFENFNPLLVLDEFLSMANFRYLFLWRFPSSLTFGGTHICTLEEWGIVRINSIAWERRFCFQSLIIDAF